MVTKAALSAPLHLISFVRLQALKVNPKLRSRCFSSAVGKAGTLVLAFMSCNINLNESSMNKMNCSLQSSLFLLQIELILISKLFFSLPPVPK